MTWWKKILSTIPLLVAGYEVGKNQEENDNKQLEKILETMKEDNVDKTTEGMSHIEIMALLLAVAMVIIYLVKLVCKTIKDMQRGQHRQPQV